MKRSLLALGLLLSTCVAALPQAAAVGFRACNAATISATAVSSNVQLNTCGATVILYNITAVEAFYVVGATSATTATTSNFSIPGNSFVQIAVPTNGDWIAAITAAGSTTLRVSQGSIQ
jgi:hypothetical protein